MMRDHPSLNTMLSTRCRVQYYANKFPKYLRKDLILEGDLFAKTYRGSPHTFDVLLYLHLQRIASELRDVAMTVALEESHVHKIPDAYSQFVNHNVPQHLSINNIIDACDVTPRSAYYLQKLFIYADMEYLP
jgi:hypothetical protein